MPDVSRRPAYSAPVLLWIFVVVIVAMGGGLAVTNLASRKKTLPSGGGPKALPAPKKGEPFVERTLRDLRVDDVITMGAKDFLCEGLLSYDEDGHRWSGARVVDGGTVYWLVMGIERASASSMRLMTQDSETQISGYPPEALVIGEVRYVLDKRGTAGVQFAGDVGSLSSLAKGRPEGHTERCRWWLYNAPGEDTMIVEQWGSDYRVMRGKRIGDGILELIPGS